MTSFIYIATTQGPVRVQAITEEDSDINSVVCLDGLAEPLGISERYHDFVKKGTGLIHREFGHGSYRVDVDKPIHQGSSWQLGMYCAHVLHREGRLENRKPGPGDQVFLVSGCVKSNGEVTEVEKVPEKFDAAHSELRDWAELGCVVSWLLIEGQSGVPNEDALDGMGFKEGQVVIYFSKSVADVNQIMGCDKTLIGKTTKTLNSPKVSKKALLKQYFRNKLVPFALATSVLLLCSIWLIVDRSNVERSDLEIPGAKGTDVDRVIVEGTGLAPSVIVNLSLAIDVDNGSGDCTNTTRMQVGMLDKHQFKPVAFSTLCALYWSTESNLSLLAFSLDRLGIIQLENVDGSWRLPLPLQQSQSREYIILVVDGVEAGIVAADLDRQLLRWGLQEGKVTLKGVLAWADLLSTKLVPYGHKLYTGFE